MLGMKRSPHTKKHPNRLGDERQSECLIFFKIYPETKLLKRTSIVPSGKISLEFILSLNHQLKPPPPVFFSIEQGDGTLNCCNTICHIHSPSIFPAAFNSGKVLWELITIYRNCVLLLQHQHSSARPLSSSCTNRNEFKNGKNLLISLIAINSIKEICMQTIVIIIIWERPNTHLSVQARTNVSTF